MYRKHLIELGNELIMFDSISNTATSVNPLDIHELPLGIGTAEHAELRIEHFHDIILTNDTEIFEKAHHATHADELERTTHWQDAVKLKETAQLEALSSTPHSLPGLIESYFFGWLGLAHDIWLNVCGILVTLYTLAIVLYFCLPNGFIQPLQRLPFLRRNPTHLTMESVVEEGVDAITLVERQGPKELNHIHIEPVVRFHKTTSDDKVSFTELDPTKLFSRNTPTTQSSRSAMTKNWSKLFNKPSSSRPDTSVPE